MFRRSAGAVTAVIAVIVLPSILVANPFMPAGVSNWLTRVTPAAAFAVQQTLVPYHQVTSIYTPYTATTRWHRGPGSPSWPATRRFALAVAAVLLRRRDA